MLQGKERKTPNKMKDQQVEVTSMFLVCHALHTAVGICHSGYADCLLASSQLNLYVLLCVES